MALRPRPDQTVELVRAATLLDAAKKTLEAAEEAARHARFLRNDAELEFDRRMLEARGVVWGETLVHMKLGAYKPGESGPPCAIVDVARRESNRPSVVLDLCDAQGLRQNDLFTTWLDQVDLEAEVKLARDEDAPAP